MRAAGPHFLDKSRRSWQTAAQVVFTLIVLGYLFYKIDRIAFVKLALSCKSEWIVAAFAAYGVTTALSIWRWHILLRACDEEIRFWRTAQLTMIGLFANAFMLGSMGGDVLKAYYTARELPHQKARAIVSIVMERLLGFLAMFLLSTILILTRYRLLTSEPITRWAVYLYFATMIFVVSLILLGSMRLFHRWIPARLEKNEALRKTAQAYHFLLRHTRAFWGGLTISIGAHVALLFTFYFVAMGVGMEIDFFDLSSILPLVGLVTLLPVTVSGMGLREFSFIHFLSICNVGREAAVALSLGGFFVLLGWNLLGGLVYLYYRLPHHDEAQPFTK